MKDSQINSLRLQSREKLFTAEQPSKGFWAKALEQERQRKSLKLREREMALLERGMAVAASQNVLSVKSDLAAKAPVVTKKKMGAVAKFFLWLVLAFVALFIYGLVTVDVPKTLKSVPATSSSLPETGSRPGAETESAGTQRETVAFAPKDAQPALNESFLRWDDDAAYHRIYYAKFRLSTSGYPIVGLIKGAPLCLNEFKVKEAVDALLANDPVWLSSISGCELFLAGAKFERLQYAKSPLTGTYKFRMIAVNGERLELFGPESLGHTQSSDWFGLYER